MLKLDCKNKDHLIKCKEIIINGGTIVYPTDTIYGLGCDPYNKKAVEKVFKIKKRLMDKPLPLLTFDIRSCGPTSTLAVDSLSIWDCTRAIVSNSSSEPTNIALISLSLQRFMI